MKLSEEVPELQRKQQELNDESEFLKEVESERKNLD